MQFFHNPRESGKFTTDNPARSTKKHHACIIGGIPYNARFCILFIQELHCVESIMKRPLADIPFAPRRFGFFYGWVIVAASTLAVFASIPGQTIAVGVFTDPLLKALNMSRENLSLAYMFGTLASGLLIPLAGTVLDRIGVRVMAVIASVGLGLSLLALSQCDRIATSIGMAGAAMIVMTPIFLLMRFFGQGNLTMVARVAIGKWFNHRRGLATAIMGLFTTFAFSGGAFLINWVIDMYKWRRACWILAGVVGGGMSLIAWVLFRDNPEQCGLVMDGIDDRQWLAEQEKKAPETKIEFTRRQALKTWSFWAFSLGLACYGLVITGISFHLTSIGEEMGRTRKETLNVFIVMSFVGITTRFIASWLTDRTKLKLKWLLLVMMTTQILGTVGVLKFADNTGWGMTALGYGITGGIWGIIFSVALPRFFGREHLGAISGLTMSICVIASAVGPWLFSLGHSLTEDYRTVIGLSMLIPAAIIVMAAKAENPQKND